jgi:hypothetical protein
MAKELPMSYKLGETQTEIHIDTAEENKNAAASLAQQARHSIDIFSQDLEAEIYNNGDFGSSVFKLAKKHPDTKVRILTQDSRKAVQNGHRLIKLAQSLTSSVFIHTPSRDYKDEKSAFLLVDQLGVLFRVNAGDRNYRASVSYNSPQRAGQLTDFFNEAWEHSTPDIQTRRIFV